MPDMLILNPRQPVEGFVLRRQWWRGTSMPVTYSAIRCAVIGYAGGQQIVNVFNVAGTAGAGEAATLVGQAYGTNFKARLASQYTFDSVHAIDMSSLEGDTYTYPMVGFGAATGGAAGEIGTCALLRWQDSISGRAYRPGKTFFGPIGKTAVDDLGLELLTGERTAIQSAADLFLDAVNVGGALVTVHGAGTPGQQLAPIIGVSVPMTTAHIDSRRR